MEVVDLFSGLGGFSQAFVDRNHDVTRYEYDKQFNDVPHTILKNIYYLTASELRHADIILASPPCTHFSIAAVSHHWPDNVPTEATLEQIELVRTTIDLCTSASPKYWILENPRGMLRTVLGLPDKFIYLGAWDKKNKKATDLWGKLPPTV